jgi:hypothetical protein
MTWHEYILIAFVVMCVIASFANAIINLTMIDALNRSRPLDDRIPVFITSVADLKWSIRNGPFPFVRILKEFHQQFPESRLYFWSIFILIYWLVVFVAVGLTFFLVR